MDVISHGIIGRAIANSKTNGKDKGKIILFAILPDLFQIPIYLFLGYINKRPLFIPLNTDWSGMREKYPNLMKLLDIPHSFLFLLTVISPVTIRLKFPRTVILAYFSHIFIDIFTHTGEWSINPFYPIKRKVEGFTDAWAWNFRRYLFSWIILTGLVVILDRLNKVWK